MRILPSDGVTTTALADGRLTLRAEGRPAAVHCTPLAATMWMALRHSDGFVDLAVESLARGWGTERAKVGAVMDAWCARLLAGGWLRPAL
ncbi:hypothetical protein [Streptomyces sp. NPDC005423]|uniref:hypothetical protein n=1 Tax=Streptomyces sp. NPDC005423 TaxID=3155343 RepID=UPI0033A7BEB8